MSELEAKKAHLKNLLSKIPPSVAGACSVQMAVKYKKDAASAQKALNSKIPSYAKITAACAEIEKYWSK